ncbi:Phosphoesterase, PA-phosphatase related protein [Thioalkalivibrio nitratireducens DSM 14787]|uniref:undecaprenyl-diphosphate phosphatase n=2 Tax=Thioalkalivibrio nitratireducens TaxID=186931 RepID=L0E1Q2_THIND|nr:Phosphoesterase, PA-phosphatase related protein [Thioalkalivibrio nitratireducens DSM 14787]
MRRELDRLWPEPGGMRSASGDRWLLGGGAVAIALAAVIWYLGGPFAGFLFLNGALEWLPDAFWGLLSSAGDGLVLGVLVLFVARRHPQILWVFFLGVIVAGILTHVPKGLLDLPRPAALLESGSFRLIGPELHSQGPPSGHALAVFLVAGVAMYFLRSGLLRLMVLAGAALVAISRVAVGAHWPLDVVLGSGLGLVGAWLSIRIAERFPWGRHPWVYLATLAFFVGAAGVLLVVFDPGYPLGRELSVFVAASTLVVVVRHHLLEPALLGAGVPRGPHGPSA